MSLDPLELAHPALLASAPYSLAVAVVAGLLGWVLFALGRGRPPRIGGPGQVDEALVAQVTEAARAAQRGAALGAEDGELLRVFYEKWLNHPGPEREALREALLDDGVDMIRLAEAVRR